MIFILDRVILMKRLWVRRLKLLVMSHPTELERARQILKKLTFGISGLSMATLRVVSLINLNVNQTTEFGTKRSRL